MLNKSFFLKWYVDECIEIKIGNVVKKFNNVVLCFVFDLDLVKLLINYYIFDGFIEIDLMLKKD